MGNFTDEIQESRMTFAQRQKELEKAIKQVSVKCPHQYTGDKANKPALKMDKDDPTMVVCKRCEEEFSMTKHDNADVMNAIKVLHDVINQLKLCSRPTNEKDMALIESLGKQDLLNLELYELYSRITDENQQKKNKKKKKKHGGNDYGGYGNIRIR